MFRNESKGKQCVKGKVCKETPERCGAIQSICRLSAQLKTTFTPSPPWQELSKLTLVLKFYWQRLFAVMNLSLKYK